MKKMFDNPINLQLFAMSEEELQAKLQELLGAEQQNEATELNTEVPQEAVEQTEPAQNVQDVQTEEGQAEGVPQEIPPAETGQPQSGPASSVIEKLRQAGVTKFNNEDDFVKSYIELEKMNTRTRQELAEVRNQLNQLTQVIQQQQQMSQPAAQNETIDSEKFLELFYEDPKQALRQVFIEVVKPELDQVVQKVSAIENEREWRQKVDEFAAEHPDLEQFAQEISEVLIENPDLKTHPKGLEIAYYMVKGRRYQPVNPLDFLQDEQFVNENIIKNDNIRKRVIEDYLQSIKKGTPPATIGKPVGNNISATVPKKPTTLDEAAEMALKMLEKG